MPKLLPNSTFLLASLVLLVSSALAQPKISSFSPTKAPVGTTVTITGSGFAANAADNTVYFGAARATVTSASPTSLAVTVPAGAAYKPLSLLNNLTHLTAFSALPFMPTFTHPFGSGIPGNFYNPPVRLKASREPFGFDIGDLDGDGKVDMAVLYSTNTLAVLRSISTTGTLDSTSFAAEVNFTAGFIPVAVSAADVDGDGKLDLVVANNFAHTVSVLRNTSTPGSIDASSFAPKVDFATGHAPGQIVVNDVDGDGLPDLLLNSDGNAISILRNTSTPGSIDASSFAPKVDIVTGATPRSFAFNDVDGDGKPDLITVNSNNISVLRNVAVPGSITTASFEAKTDFPVTYNPSDYPFGFPGLASVLASDFDGDGRVDLATIVGGQTFKLAVLRNTAVPGSIAPSSFAPETDVLLSAAMAPPQLGDVDGDGRVDIVGISNSSTPVLVVRNLSTPGTIIPSSFAPVVSFPADGGIRPFIIGDLDGDGLAEIITGNGVGGNNGFISILKINASGSGSTPPISIASFNPASGPVGTAVTITGSGFAASPAGNIVYFGPVKATVTNASATSLTVTVPAGASYRPISVLNTTTGLTAYTLRPFAPTFTHPFGSGIPTNFYLPLSLSQDAFTLSAAAGDLDGDGKPELVAGKPTALDILHNNSTGALTNTSFAVQQHIASPSQVSFVATADLDGDGRLDVLSLRTNANAVSVYRNLPGQPGTVAGAQVFGVGTTPTSLAIGDLDRDGKPDLAIANTGSGTVSVLHNTSTPGTISFDPAVDFAAGSECRSVAIGDLNGDGRPELVVANFSPGTLTVLSNISTVGRIIASSFAGRVGFVTAPRPVSVVIGDINNDGKPELVAVSNDRPGLLSVLQNRGDSIIVSNSFAPRIDFPASNDRSYSVIADVDGDGKPDAIIGGSGPVSVLRNTGASGDISASSLAAAVDFSVGSTSSLLVTDLDVDGVPEIVSTNFSEYITVLKVNTSLTVQVPKITAFTPVSGPPGTSVTITGSGFNPTAADNTVFFGTAKGVVTAASANSLTVTAPAGATYQPLSVQDKTTGLLGYSPLAFTTTFSNPFGPGTIPSNFYKPKVDFTTGFLPYFVVLADLNGDNRPEMLVANANATTLSMIKNRATDNISNLSFDNKVDYQVGASPRSIAVGDLDGDGLPDVVTVSSFSSTLSVLRNLSTGINATNLATKVDFFVGAGPFSVAIADVDGDGKPDIVVANSGANTISVMRNLSTPGIINVSSFASRIDYPAGTGPRFLAVNDLDGDGKPEIAVVNERSNTVSVLRNTATAGVIDANSFAPMVGFAVGSSPGCLVTSDIDGDGKPELVTCNYGSNTVSVLRNTTVTGTIDAASFAAKVDYTTGAQPFFVAAGDADGDGKPDLAVADAGAGTVSLLRNTAVAGAIDAASFAPGATFTVGGYPISVALGDLDGNGSTELVSANAAGNQVSVLAINIQPPVIASVNPVSGPVGSSVTITGANFNSLPAGNTVYFGAVKAAVISSTNTGLVVKVPAGAIYQPISVLNNATGLTGYSPLPFTPAFTNPFGSGIPDNFYRPKVDLTIGSVPFYSAIADLDGDGKSDLVIANLYSRTVSVLRNISSTGTIDAASFASNVDFFVPADTRSLVVSDLDGDGKLDIVLGGASSYTISVLRNTSTAGAITTASFAPRVDFPNGMYISALAAGDLDGDGKPDLVVTNAYTGSASIWRNVSTPGSINAGSFVPGTSLTTGSFPRFVALSDLDRDGRIDIAIANEKSNNVSVWRNTALGTPGVFSFAARVDFAAGITPPCVAAGDLDGDGKPELVVCNYGSNTVSVLRNTSTAGAITDASFAAPIDIAVGATPFFTILGDADGDGKPDILVANTNTNAGVSASLSVLRNTTTVGSIAAASFTRTDFAVGNYPFGGYPVCIGAGDLDGDGIAEVTILDAAINGISVFKVNSPAVMQTANSALGIQHPAAEPGAQSMQLYPNPTRGRIVVQLPVSRAGTAHVEVLDESGKVIEKKTFTSSQTTSQTMQFNLRNQPAGIYYVKLTNKEGVQVIKVVLQ